MATKKATSEKVTGAVTYAFDEGERLVLENHCAQVSTRDRSFFIGASAERGFQGHCLCETTADGLTRHWGSSTELHSILDEASE